MRASSKSEIFSMWWLEFIVCEVLQNSLTTNSSVCPSETHRREAEFAASKAGRVAPPWCPIVVPRSSDLSVGTFPCLIYNLPLQISGTRFFNIHTRAKHCRRVGLCLFVLPGRVTTFSLNRWQVQTLWLCGALQERLSGKTEHRWDAGEGTEWSLSTELCISTALPGFGQEKRVWEENFPWSECLLWRCMWRRH